MSGAGGPEKLNSWISLCKFCKQGEVGLPGMASAAHQAALSFCFLWTGKENTKRKLLGGDEDRDHSPVTVMGKQTQLGK